MSGGDAASERATVAEVDIGAFVGPVGRLAEGAPDGPLTGLALGVKDLFDVAGTVTGAGNPTYGEGRTPATMSATAVTRLVEAGATVVGKTVTDELAFSLSGTNIHYGTPVNSAAPGHVPGGSSAGSAAAVAGGLVDLALGTDTAGSIRVPASHCEILGWRPTHGVVPIDRVVPLAPSFDTVGLFARRFDVLRAGAAALLGGDRVAVAEPLGEPRRLGEAFDASSGGLDPDLARLLIGLLEDVGVDNDIELGVDLADALGAQRTRQSWEAWQAHGDWIRRATPTLGPGIAARFEAASQVQIGDVEAVAPLGADVARRMHRLLAEGPLVIPAAGGPPAPLEPGGDGDGGGGDRDRAAHDHRRAASLRLTCVAGLAGAPVVVVPGARVGPGVGLPVGVALIGAPGTDLELIDAAERLHERIQSR